MEVNQEDNMDIRLKRDLNYIKRDIIAPQIDGAFCKFSRTLNGISVIGLTERQYEGYWQSQYKDSKLQLPVIMPACKDKFKNGLTSQVDMINIINKSSDFTKDRYKAIQLLGGIV